MLKTSSLLSSVMQRKVAHLKLIGINKFIHRKNQVFVTQEQIRKSHTQVGPFLLTQLGGKRPLSVNFRPPVISILGNCRFH